ncbi:hypothetical protein MM221_12845 [Salipaludibacillus sp. LMS25]|jgi:hypothetical protein|uniref:hypothetical protein n=1 Tax=Salipaludibacillus sp. LMS25 TaxID=2924031 RepID=UPI0020D1D804|nr:hypothetical protein [Salipaludibacillus sp. LMS25]UTR13512.1 hypothetical protein MM221_12845 [Salipaludibacillus sp. LMS25]
MRTTSTKISILNGIPNSSVDIIDSNSGKIKTRRYFGPDEKGIRNVDMADRGSQGT